MAYMQHDCLGRSGGSTGIATRSVIKAILTPLELQVVALAGREPLSSLRTTRRPIAQALFGVVPARALADPRLEALRRFVVLHRHGRDTARCVDALSSLGFTQEQLAAVGARVVCRAGSALPGIATLAMVALLITCTVLLFWRHVGELLPAVAVGLAVCLPLVPAIHNLVAPTNKRGVA